MSAEEAWAGLLRRSCQRCKGSFAEPELQLELIVEPPASTGGRQVGLERKPRNALASWAEAEFETQPGNFPRLKLVR